MKAKNCDIVFKNVPTALTTLYNTFSKAVDYLDPLGVITNHFSYLKHFVPNSNPFNNKFI